MSRTEHAPLFSDGFSLCQWLIERLGEHTSVLPRRICRTVLALFEHLVLALENIDREHHIDDADQSLILLRVQVRLPGATGYLDHGQMLHALTIITRFGHPLGGWQRSLHAA